jgi:hypothetical protein
MTKLAVLLAAFSFSFGIRLPGSLAAEAKLLAYSDGLKPYRPAEAGDFSPEAKLSGARGEWLNLLLKADGCAEPKLELPDVPAAARFYEVLEFTTRHPSYRGARVGAYLDPVIPRHGKICGNGWILAELRIPENAAPGIYHGKISAGDAGSLPLELKVWKMEMPDRPSVPLYSELTTWFLLLGHYGDWHAGEAELARLYERSMLEHRIVPLKHWVKPLKPEGEKVDLHSGPDSFASTVVEPLPSWAMVSVPFPTMAPANYFSAVGTALGSDGLLGRAFAYLWDEPKPADFSNLKELAARARQAAPGMKILVTTPYKPELSDLVDIFVPVMDQFDRPGFPPVSAYKNFSAKPGKEFWLYASCMSHGCENDADSGSPDWVIDRPGTHIRSEAWIARKFGAKALLYYSVDNGYQNFKKGRDPWNDLWDFTGNGDGTLYYPGRPGQHGLEAHAPVESLRLKLWRQSSYDAEYAAWMDALATKPIWWPLAQDALVRTPRDWEHSDRAYRELRERMGDYLDKKTGSQ